MFPINNVLLADEEVPISLIPAISFTEQVRIILNTLESLSHPKKTDSKFDFYQILSSIQTKELKDLFLANNKEKEENYRYYKNICLIFLQNILIHDLFTNEKYSNLMQSIRKKLQSDSVDWVCVITENSICTFVLSVNYILLWSPIISGIQDFFLA
ncbi:MAG: hypothetical protein ACXACR_16460, partial [Candidatus Hodarchaeales archaeon]